jgi:hypothetical protein
MRKRVAAWLFAGWLLGMATFWVGLQVTGGMWDYYVTVVGTGEGVTVRQMVNEGGWEVIRYEDNGLFILRRGRFVWR